MDEQQTPEDDQAELYVRALMPLLGSSWHPEFGEIKSTRDGVPSHTLTAASEATMEVCRRFGAPGGSIGITERANAFLSQRFDASGRLDSRGTLWAEMIRRALVAADEGEVHRGTFADMWRDLCKHASA